MAQWCLTKQAEAKLLEELQKDGDPQKMVARGTAGRLAWFTERVGKENAERLNALFESKMLLKNQQAGFLSFARQLGGNKKMQRDLISKVQGLDKALDEAQVDQYLESLINKRLGLEVTEEQFNKLTELTKKTNELKTLANAEGVFPSETDRLKYGLSQVEVENYVNDLKLQARSISFKEEPIKKVTEIVTSVPGMAKSLMSSLDNSFWGRQGIKVLANPRTADVWFKNFLKSWKDIGLELKGTNAIDLIKADIYSRPNALNGKYRTGGYGLDVFSEEAFPSSLPEKIPVLRRLFKASESAYNGAALRLRADLADRFIKKAEKFGVNTLNGDEAKALSKMILSMTGRGNLGKAEVISKELNNLFFSVKFLKSNVDTLMAPLDYLTKKAKMGQFKNKGEEFAKRESAKNWLNMLATYVTILGVWKALDPDAVEEDPRSTNFGKVKIWGQWRDITGGMGGIVTLGARLVPTYHNGELGFWTKTNKGEFRNLTKDVAYGGQTGWDVLTGFFEGKLSPFARVMKDIYTGKDFSGNEVTPQSVISSSFTPLSLQNMDSLMKDPNASFILGSIVLESLGFGASSSIIPNSKSKTFQENKNVKDKDIINYVSTYAEALGTDPETAFNRIFTGQEIKKVTNGTVIVQRMPLKDSTNVKKKLGGNNPTMKLDHTIPLELGGSNDESNLKLVTTAEWGSYTKVENALGKALKENKISKNEAQKLIVDFKNKKIPAQQILNRFK